MPQAGYGSNLWKFQYPNEMKTKLLNALFIDPYKQQVVPIAIADDIGVWHRVLACGCVEPVRIDRVGKLVIDIWLDESRLLRKPMAPRFKIRDTALIGYGLVLARNDGGETASLPANFTLAAFVDSTRIGFEPYQIRIKPEDCIEQLTRSLELEQPGKVCYLR
jgi:hypothetical protein